MDYENGAQNGYVWLHRRLKHKAFYKKSAYVHIWVHLLLSANHAPAEFMWNGEVVILHRGQLITGRKELAQQTGVPETTIERILNFLENEHQIGQQKTTKYRLITILNWDSYQKVDIVSDNKRTTSGQQADTNKNNNNNKKNKDTASKDADSPMNTNEFIQWCRKSKQRHINLIGEYVDEKKAPQLETKGQWSSFIRRNLRPAKSLSLFDDKQIQRAMNKIKEADYITRWTLETLLKYIEE